MTEMSKYPWAQWMQPGDFISEKPSYPIGKYLDLFEDRVFAGCDEQVGQLRYYVYDPVKHGAPADRRYPVIFALHGAGGSLAGKLAVNWAGVEMFASPDYQARMGGAYIVAPLANETGDPKNPMTWMTPLPGGNLEGYSPKLRAQLEPWLKENPRFLSLFGADSIYTTTLWAVLQEARASFTNAGKTVLFGTSAGGYGAWRFLLRYTQAIDAALIMAGAYLPSEADLEKIRSANLPLWLCHGRHDECVPFERMAQPILPLLEEMPTVQTYFPELVRRGDHGVASNAAGGMEIGQHCINDAIQQDLIFEDGQPYDERFPDGVTGWVKRNAG